MEEIVLQNPGVVLLPKDSFGKRTAAKLVFKLKKAEPANSTTTDFLRSQGPDLQLPGGKSGSLLSSVPE